MLSNMKSVGLAASLGALLCAVGTPALAQEAAPTINSGDTAWILTATALVLFMTLPGLALFYGGLVRAKNYLSVLMKVFAIAALASLVWIVAGYSIAFGGDGLWWGVCRRRSPMLAQNRSRAPFQKMSFLPSR